MQVESTITLKSEEVAKIIADYINANFTIETPIAASAVKFSVNAGYDDRMSYSAPSLNCAEVKVKIAPKRA